MNPDGSQDRYLRNFYPEHNGLRLSEPGRIVGWVPDEHFPEYSAPLKFTSGVRDIQAQFGMVLGGRENAVDCNNHASWICVQAEVWDISRTKYGFTNKGGCQNNQFAGLVRGHGKECDFDQDNWSDQSHDACVGTVLALVSEDGKPLRVRYLYQKPYCVEGTGPYKFVFPWPWLPLPRWVIGKVFNQLRRMGWFR